MIGWEVDTRDWEPNTTADLVYQRVAESLAPGVIILMHERPEATWQALPRVLDLLDREGYRAVTVGDLLRAAAAEQKN